MSIFGNLYDAIGLSGLGGDCLQQLFGYGHSLQQYNQQQYTPQCQEQLRNYYAQVQSKQDSHLFDSLRYTQPSTDIPKPEKFTDNIIDAEFEVIEINGRKLLESK